MGLKRRAVFVVAAPVVLATFLAASWRLLPFPTRCVSLFCGRDFDPGGANVFGYQLFTPAQSMVMAIGILTSAMVLARGLFPGWARWALLGFGAFVLAAVVSVTVPSPITGPPPSVPCSTPGPNGPVDGRCVTGSAPVDERVRDRMLVVGGGLLVFGVAAFLDRRRSLPGPAAA